MRCYKCTFNIASGYEEGLCTIIKQGWEMNLVRMLRNTCFTFN